jgi:histidinol phosphatase-like enzyme
MVDRAVSELQADLRKAYVVGDHANDIQLAKAAGEVDLVTSDVSTGVDDGLPGPFLTWSRRWQRRAEWTSQMPHKQHGQVSLDDRTITNWFGAHCRSLCRQ